MAWHGQKKKNLWVLCIHLSPKTPGYLSPDMAPAIFSAWPRTNSSLTDQVFLFVFSMSHFVCISSTGLSILVIDIYPK